MLPLYNYPNPSNDIFNVRLNDYFKDMSTYEIAEITLINLLGEVILSKQANSNSFKLDLSTNNKGIYFIKITVGNKYCLKKIIKN